MTRKEQITDAAFFYANKNKKDPIPYLDFIEAVEWADRTMIEKLSNYLQDNHPTFYESFGDEIRKVMEE